MKVVLAVLLQNYEMELVDEVKPIAGAGTYWPAQPCRVRYRKRDRGTASGADMAERAKAAGCPVHH
jgi:sterol 14-demethylase